MAVLRVVLDSCVLYPMYLRDTLLCAAEANLYRPHWSEKILGDAIRNLIEDGRMTQQKAERLEQQIKTSFPEAEISVTSLLLPCMPNHEGDRHVLAAALIAKAHVIVTDNLRHFPSEALEPFRIEAQSPDRFLTSLFDLFPESMSEVISRQVSAMRKPPMTVLNFLELLEKAVPTFATRMRDIF